MTFLFPGFSFLGVPSVYNICKHACSRWLAGGGGAPSSCLSAEPHIYFGSGLIFVPNSFQTVAGHCCSVKRLFFIPSSVIIGGLQFQVFYFFKILLFIYLREKESTSWGRGRGRSKIPAEQGA